MKRIFATIAVLTAAAGVCSAQSVVRMPVEQNPLFEVSANHVNVSASGDNGITLGADLVIKGGSGTYSYRWYSSADRELGNEPTLAVSGPGVYMLDITDTCDCMQTVEFNVTNAGVADIEYGSLVLSPNPSDGPVAVDGFDAVQIAVVGMSGRMELLVDRSGYVIREFDVSDLARGQYIVTLSDSEGHVAVARLIKK